MLHKNFRNQEPFYKIWAKGEVNAKNWPDNVRICEKNPNYCFLHEKKIRAARVFYFNQNCFQENVLRFQREKLAFSEVQIFPIKQWIVLIKATLDLIPSDPKSSKTIQPTNWLQDAKTLKARQTYPRARSK